MYCQTPHESQLNTCVNKPDHLLFGATAHSRAIPRQLICMESPSSLQQTGNQVPCPKLFAKEVHDILPVSHYLALLCNASLSAKLLLVNMHSP